MRLLTLRSVLAYQRCDQFSEWLIYFMILFSPWAFGTTQPWSIWTMNLSGYLLGLLLAIKLAARCGQGYTPARWDRAAPPNATADPIVTRLSPNLLTRTLALLTVAIPGYCLVAAVNARSTYDPLRMAFDFHPHLSWLPHSYDRHRTWQSFANYLALAGFFWAVRDWLPGKTAGEIRAARSEHGLSEQTSFLPGRLRRLLWVLSLNGALLAIEGIVQRLEGSDKLLWLVRPRLNAAAEYQFGPYAYRGNAAQYFNLVWPAALAFWWTLRREVRARLHSPSRWGRVRSHLLLPGVLLMAACPILSLSRGGALVAVAGMAGAAFLLLLGLRRRHSAVKFGVLLLFGAALGLGLYLGWDKLGERFKETERGWTEREVTYQTARQIARDYPLFGTGPGTFEPVFQLYRSSPEEYWPAQLHNDWLETRITFGWVGSALIALAFLVALARWFFPGHVQVGWRFTSLLGLALAGCLAHARYDFPLQIYSVLLLFLLLCSILSCLSRRGGAN